MIQLFQISEKLPNFHFKKLFFSGQILLISSLMLLSGCNDDSNSTSSVATGNAISGFVIDDPVANAKVSYTLTDGTFLGSTTTSQNGAFSLPLSTYQAAQVQISGNVLITAEKDGKILRGLSCFDYKGGACQDNSTYVSHYSEAALQVAENTLVDKKEFYKAFLENYKQGNYLPADVSSDPIVPVAQAVQSQFYNVTQPSTQVNGISGILETRTNSNAADTTSKLVYSDSTCKMPICEQIKQLSASHPKATLEQILYYKAYMDFVKVSINGKQNVLIAESLDISNNFDSYQKVSKIIEILTVIGKLGAVTGDVQEFAKKDIKEVKELFVPMLKLLKSSSTVAKDIPLLPEDASNVFINGIIDIALEALVGTGGSTTVGTVGGVTGISVGAAIALVLEGSPKIANILVSMKAYSELMNNQEFQARNTFRECILKSYLEDGFGNIEVLRQDRGNNWGKTPKAYSLNTLGTFDISDPYIEGLFKKAESGCPKGINGLFDSYKMSNAKIADNILAKQIAKDIEWLDRIVASYKDALKEKVTLKAIILNPSLTTGKIKTGTKVTFNGVATGFDATYQYEWTINNGEGATVKNTEKVEGIIFNKSGIYEAIFKVTDKNNKSVQEKVTIYAVNPLQVKINPIQEATVDSAINLGYSIMSGDGIEAIQWKTDPQVEGFNTSALSPEQSNKITFKKAGTYTLTLLVVNFAGDVITDTLQLTVKDKAAVSIITPPALTAKGGTEANSVQIDWTAVKDAQSYNLYRDGTKTQQLNSINFTDKGLNSGLTGTQQYCYQVSAVVNNVESSLSNKVCATPTAKPSTPDTTTGNDSNSSRITFYFMALKDGKNIVPQKWCLKAGQDASKCADGSNTYTLEMPFVTNTTYKGIAYVDNVAYESTTSYTTTTIAPTQRIEFMITIPTTTPQTSTTDYKVRVVENVNGKQVGVSGVHVSVFTGGIPPIEINGAGKATDANGYVTLNLSSTGSYSAGVIISSTYNATNNISLNKGTENILVVSKKQPTDTNTGNNSFSLTGNWKGHWTIDPFTKEDLRQEILQNVGLEVSLAQNGESLSGTLRVTDTQCFSGGNIKGTIKGNVISFGSVDGMVSYTGTVYPTDKFIYGTWNTMLPCYYTSGYWGIVQ
ncbi:MAG: hypothetical protein RJA13_1381 [Bacteroidota bacterium]|jgi:hypothetical protein